MKLAVYRYKITCDRKPGISTLTVEAPTAADALVMLKVLWPDATPREISVTGGRKLTDVSKQGSSNRVPWDE